MKRISKPNSGKRSTGTPQEPRHHRHSNRTLRNHPVETLHRAVGNGTVQSLHANGTLRATLAVSQPGDKYEREAERVADHVMRGSNGVPMGVTEGDHRGLEPAATSLAAGDRSDQSQSPEQGTDMYRRATQQHRADKPLDCESCLPNHRGSPGQATTPTVSADRTDTMPSPHGGGRPLSGSVRSFFEPRFGHDLGDVRVHTGGDADAAARAIRARAFTVGRDIVFRSGEYRPETSRGKRLIAHELTHVLQQRRVIQRQDADGDQDTSSPRPVCVPDRPLTWNDFNGSPDQSSDMAAFTSADLDDINQQMFQATFESSSSWVKPGRDVEDRTRFDGVPETVDQCKDVLGEDTDSGRYMTLEFEPDESCDASHHPPEEFRAETEGECETYGEQADHAAKKESNRLLNHEQRHFDIACELAKAGNDLLDNGVEFGPVQQHLNRSITELNEEYDDETDHGCNESEQEEWDTGLASKVDEAVSDIREQDQE